MDRPGAVRCIWKPTAFRIPRLVIHDIFYSICARKSIASGEKSAKTAQNDRKIRQKTTERAPSRTFGDKQDIFFSFFYGRYLNFGDGSSIMYSVDIYSCARRRSRPQGRRAEAKNKRQPPSARAKTEPAHRRSIWEEKHENQSIHKTPRTVDCSDNGARRSAPVRVCGFGHRVNRIKESYSAS
ncbi:unknown [Anaerotruncus sp. CAG:390]|nr:unknown [Anaerotruncus sp. CAG:390]